MDVSLPVRQSVSRRACTSGPAEQARTIIDADCEAMLAIIIIHCINTILIQLAAFGFPDCQPFQTTGLFNTKVEVKLSVEEDKKATATRTLCGEQKEDIFIRAQIKLLIAGQIFQ